MLIMLYILLVVLIIWDAAFFLASFNESNVTKINLDSISALYSAENGLSCAVFEIKSHPGWYTHFADPNNGYALVEINVAPPNLTTLCKIDNTPSSEYYGCYVSLTNVPGTTTPEFALKTYLDPTSSHNNPETLVLIKGNSPSINRLFVAKINSHSLYDYFVFTPYDLWMGPKAWKALGGRMHANGSVVWQGSSTIEDVSEFTTPRSFMYNVTADAPPDPGQEEYVNEVVTPSPCQTIPAHPDCAGNPNLTWTDIYANSLRSPDFNPCYPNPGNCLNKSYLNYPDRHLATDSSRLKMFNGNLYVPWDGVGLYIDPRSNPSIYQMPASYTKFIRNGTPISIPNRLAQTYDWQEYADATQQFHYPEQPPIQVAYTDSEKQPSPISGWPAFLNANGLNGILKDSGAGGQYIEPQKVMTDIFHDEAEAGGLLIFKNAQDKLEMLINGTTSLVEHNGVISDPHSGKVIAEKITFYNTNSGQQNTIARLRMKDLIDAGLYPNNGILYCDNYGVALAEAEKIQDIGLTAVSPENIILEGNFNNLRSAPAAMITAKETYTVSDKFKYPGQLQFTLHNPNYPFESDEGPPWNWNQHENQMPELVNHGYTYVTSLVGSTRGYLGEVLERWGNYTRTIIGSSIQLKYEYFEPPGWFDGQRTRYCCQGNPPPDPCFAGPYCRNTTLPQWEGEGMTFTYPTPNTYQFDINYLPGTGAARPPGDFFGDSKDVWLEINYNDSNFTHHYAPIN